MTLDLMTRVCECGSEHLRPKRKELLDKLSNYQLLRLILCIVEAIFTASMERNAMKASHSLHAVVFFCVQLWPKSASDC